MKYHCNRCNQDFTTLSEKDESRKFAFAHLILNKMSCPNCGASNRTKPLKPLKKTRGRYQPRRKSLGEDAVMPDVILHTDCRTRIVGNPMNIGGIQVACEGCRSVFNCWTGNVDDGDYNSPLEKSIEERREEARVKIAVAETKRDDELDYLNHLRTKMGKIDFGYEFGKGAWYARFGGTTWKLDNEDVTAIRSGHWNTIKTRIIERTLQNRRVSVVMAKSLLLFEIQIKERA